MVERDDTGQRMGTPAIPIWGFGIIADQTEVDCWPSDSSANTPIERSLVIAVVLVRRVNLVHSKGLGHTAPSDIKFIA